MKHTKILITTTLTVFLMSGFGFAQDTTLTVTGDGSVGIGITAPAERLDINGGSMKISNTGQTNALVFRPFIYLNHEGQPDAGIADFGGGIIWQKDSENRFEMFYSNIDSGLVFWDTQSGPHYFFHRRGEMWAGGMIESRSGGFKFPDGTVQTTATTGGGGSSPWSAAAAGSGIFYGDRVGIGTDDVQIQLALGDSDTGFQQEGDGELAVYTDFTERMRFTNGGKVGIGTSTPIWQVNVQNASPFGTGLVLGNESSGGRQWTAISSGESNSEGPGKYLLRDEQANAVRMTIDTDGKVGIGSFTPTEMLQVADFSTASDNYITVKSAGGQIYKSGIKLRHFDETNGFTIYSDDASSGGRIGLHILHHHITFPEGGKLALFIDRLNGNVGFATNTPSHPLEMASGAHVTAGGVWTNASSRELKENIAGLTATEALSALLELNPVQYNYKSEKDEKYLGFIAEDVPDVLATKDRKSLSPMDIVAVLTKVVQEQQKKIAELAARLDSRR